MLDKDRKTNEVKAHCQGGSVGGSPPNQSRKQPLFSPPTQQQQQPCTMDALFYHGPWSKEWGEASAGQPRFTEQAEIQRGRMMVRRQRERKGLFGAEGILSSLACQPQTSPSVSNEQS